MPQISIITINLNNVVGLQKTIKSVVRQTYADKEYIIIDGGSVDGSLNLIKENVTRITYWVSEPDFGIYNAMNKGIKLAKGKWIIFMNSGDIFKDEKVIEIVFKDSNFNHIDILYGNTLYKDTNKLVIVPDKIKKNYFFFSTLCHQSVFTNIESFKKIGNYDLRYTYISDREWLLRAKHAHLKFQYVNEIVSEWDPDGFCKNNLQLLLTEVNNMRKSHFSFFENFALRMLNRVTKFIKWLL